MKKIISYILLFLILLNNNFVFAKDLISNAQKHPCYYKLFIDEDKYEKFNRKIFNLNLRMNKIVVKNIHLIWASLFPLAVINSLTRAYDNIEYPKKAMSCLLQRDIDGLKHETKRFLINTTIGFAGLIDLADKLFNLEPYNEDMEQAFAKCKFKCGNYLVLPFISSTSTRDLFGRLFDFLLNPTTYIATPLTAMIKAGLLINRTAYIQPIIKMVESNYIDPYDIARKFYGVEKHIKLSNYDRKNIITNLKDDYDEIELVDTQKQENLQVKGKVSQNENLIVDKVLDTELSADIFLNDYNPQNPILDSMRTALFASDASKSIWAFDSIWNRCFDKKMKSAKIEISQNREKYKIRYILQKDKNSPLAILFPSIGEGVNNSHSVVLAKMFYDNGYSVLILGNHFQWEFLKSIKKGHKLGLIKEDVKFIHTLVDNSIRFLSKKYDRIFLNRVALGTSLGAYAVLFLANEQYEIGANNIDKFIAICPPFELLFAVEQIDKVIGAWNSYPDDLKEKIAQTAARVIYAFKNKEKLLRDFDKLPFSNYEAKLISAFIFHQKLSDLIYATELENNENINKQELYENIYNSNFMNYIEKYLLCNYTKDELLNMSSIRSISNYLINKDNYKIFHSLDDYLTNKNQLKELKSYADKKLVLFNNGSHLGFLYRDEFREALLNEIKIAQNK